MAMNGRALPTGAIVHGRYRIEKTLGAGGFGVTYRVMDLKEKRIAAMKEYMPLDAAYRPAGSMEVRATSESKRPQYEKFRQRFLEEAQTIYKFRGHPNIVEVKHLFYDNNTAYYVMEYVEGMDLKQFLANQGGKISWKMLAPIITQVVAGLKQVHSGGMIHCDISPDNIFLMKSGAVKLLDFGAARSTLRGMVETSVIVAKPGYSPYEQLRGKEMGPWTDVYALAVTIYRCMTGSVAKDANERIIQDNTIWPSQMGIAIPGAQWEAALKKGMALRKEDRFQSVMDFWTALNGGLTSPVYQQQSVGNPGGVSKIQGNSKAYQPNVGQKTPALQGLQGVFAGNTLPVSADITLGVDPSRCHITFPLGTPGISRVHIRLWPEGGRILAVDMGSTYGSWVDGQKMNPGNVYPLNPGSVLYLGGGQVFRAI